MLPKTNIIEYIYSMRKNNYLLMIKSFLIKISLFTLLSCQNQIPFQNTENTDFVLPEISENLLKNTDIEFLEWKIEIISAEKIYEFRINKNCKKFSVELEKNIPTAILCTPLFVFDKNSESNEKKEFFNSAGTIYPYSNNLKWNQGFSGKIFKNLIIRSKSKNSESSVKSFLLYFNWQKFMNVIEEKSKIENYNPFFCDSEKIVTSIMNKKFSSIYLNMKEVKTVDKSEICIDSKEDVKIFSKYIPEIDFNFGKTNENQKFCVKNNQISTFLAQNNSNSLFYIIYQQNKDDSILIKKVTCK